MAEQHHILISVMYEPDATELQRSLASLVPETARTALALSERDDVRTWTGVLDAKSYARLVAAWRLDEHRCHRHPDARPAAVWRLDEHSSHRHTFDGRELEAGGSSPIVSVSLTVTKPEVDPVEQQQAA